MRDTKSNVFRSTFTIVVMALLLLPLGYLSHRLVYGHEDSASSEYTSISEDLLSSDVEYISEDEETVHAESTEGILYTPGFIEDSIAQIEYNRPTITGSQHATQSNEPTDSPVEESTTECNNAVESVLTAIKGVNYNINGNKETWYNLNMHGVICIMRRMGFSEEEYPYWVRDDGVKMLGDYVMVAANLDTYPRGSIVHTSLGEGLVCDTGEFALTNPTQFDIAVNW